ncbi:hypothetical protein CJ030_MR2G020347 [Morella rubra]|uniref:Uncharacterized protein n=1 Tax=Morella rubra TaxID=262757 RepID=A0A6A1W7W4_9ROSI|nr:hypothetical protein CJ030_MR0G020330 [Morella rubra]KAB1221255.1 hypothetical protein CJ030_MR2G020347 [Morella rubra]
MNYFFSSEYDGEQCKNGQHFRINVTHGQELPKSLESPAEESHRPISPNTGDDGSVPDTVVPSNFNNPHEETADNEASGSASFSMYWKLKDRTELISCIHYTDRGPGGDGEEEAKEEENGGTRHCGFLKRYRSKGMYSAASSDGKA